MNAEFSRLACEINRRVRVFIPAVCWTVMISVNGWAIAPAYVSDAELAKHPIVVVAQWKRGDFKPHHRYRGEDNENVIVAVEAFTELEILRVIKGDVKPGTAKLKVGGGIGWSEDGSGVSSASSTELPGDVDNVTAPNLWFLQLEKSWDENDRSDYLSINNYRAVQPLAMEAYFRRLSSKHPEQEVPELLFSDKVEVVQRALRYVCGGMTPSLDPDEFSARYLEPRDQGKLLKEQANSVRKVVEQTKAQQVRETALVAYWNLVGSAATEFTRGLLRDENSSLRAAAVVLLARQRDEHSLQAITDAVEGVRDGQHACSVIKALVDWGDTRLVPALISFLRNGESAGFYGDDLFIPALKAKEALYSVTGHYFAFDVESSRRAWEAAQNIANKEERKQRLDTLQPQAPSPLRAELIGDGTTNAAVRIENNWKEKVVISRCPGWVEQKWPGGVAGCRIGKVAGHGNSEFVTLAPAASIDVSISLLDSYLLAEPSTRKLTLAYTDNGSSQGVNAWIGLVNAQFGTAWNEQRNMVKVEEKWPNGNLKAVGQTVNGKRFGDWEFFNENGDRTEIIGYTGGHGSAVCNPEHPDNKGAGKRKN